MQTRQLSDILWNNLVSVVVNGVDANQEALVDVSYRGFLTAVLAKLSKVGVDQLVAEADRVFDKMMFRLGTEPLAFVNEVSSLVFFYSVYQAVQPVPFPSLKKYIAVCSFLTTKFKEFLKDIVAEGTELLVADTELSLKLTEAIGIRKSLAQTDVVRDMFNTVAAQMFERQNAELDAAGAKIISDNERTIDEVLQAESNE